MTRATPPPDKKPLYQSNDGGFRTAIIIFTTIVFAVAFGWLGCIQRKETGEVEFHWQWRALLWIGIGIGCTIYFWHQIWPKQNKAPLGARKRIVKGWAALLIPSVMWMAYPLLFVSGQQLLNVFIGLAVAVMTLTFGGWMVLRLIRGFADEEMPSIVDSTSVQNSENNNSKKY